MLEILQNFEQVATRFAPLVLIVPGLAAIIVGLFIWLGGLGFRKLLVVLTGAITGGICVFFLSSRNIITVTIAAGLAALIATIFERLFITILLAALVAAFGFAILLGPYIQAADTENSSKITNQGSTVTISQSVEIVKAYAIDFTGRIKQACSQIPVYNWAIIAALAVIVAVAGFWLWRLASALCCAALGTLLIFIGMILLLLYKGSAPITKLANSTSFYAAIFIGMTAFGTVEQLLLCRGEEGKSKRKKRISSEQQAPEQATRGWRTT
ncbi:MAG: hypothetical protein ACE5NM_01630 [Sedimentisphaerales bacterium]